MKYTSTNYFGNLWVHVSVSAWTFMAIYIGRGVSLFWMWHIRYTDYNKPNKVHCTYPIVCLGKLAAILNFAFLSLGCIKTAIYTSKIGSAPWKYVKCMYHTSSYHNQFAWLWFTACKMAAILNLVFWRPQCIQNVKYTSYINPAPWKYIKGMHFTRLYNNYFHEYGSPGKVSAIFDLCKWGRKKCTNDVCPDLKSCSMQRSMYVPNYLLLPQFAVSGPFELLTAPLNRVFRRR